jgi:hypothetical protein
VVEGGVFYQRVKDRIEFVRYGANYRAANQGNVSAAGLEGMVRLSFPRLSSYLSGCVQRTIMDGSLESQPPASYPNALGLLGAELAVPELHSNLNAELRWVSARGASQANTTINNGQSYSLPAYSLLNATISVVGLHLLGPGAETRLLIRARNLLDVRFSEPGYAGFDSPSLGRVFALELRQLF